MKKRKSAVFDVVGYIVLFLIVLIVVLPAFLADRLIIQIGCGRDQMAAALLPVGVGGDAVPLRHESDPGA